jgi:anti-sigma regulatory factor (Ser/Thr protein kinase)
MTVRQLPSDPTSAREARSFVVQALDGAGRDVDSWTASLLVSELVTNAVQHAEDAIDVSVETDPVVRVAVHDRAERRLVPELEPSLDAEHGRGLLLVDRLARRWGVDESTDDGGKTVWFEL